MYGKYTEKKMEMESHARSGVHPVSHHSQARNFPRSFYTSWLEFSFLLLINWY